MQPDSPDLAVRINSFSLVSYIPGALGEFLTNLRKELQAGSEALSHVTVLPPRPLDVEVETAESELRMRIPEFPPIDLEMPRLEVFDLTSVIYVEIGRGREQLLEMHECLNSGALAFEEPYEYHPHITLAQGIEPEVLAEKLETAVARWREAAPARAIELDTLTFVQNTLANRWIDLSEYELRGDAVAV